MKKSDKILVAAASGVVLGMALMIAYRINKKRKSQQIANEGYEFAEDILYPLKSKKSIFRFQGSKAQ